MARQWIWIATATAIQPAVAYLNPTHARHQNTIHAFQTISTNNLPTASLQSHSVHPSMRPYSTSTPLAMSYNNNNNNNHDNNDNTSIWFTLKNAAKSTAKAVVPKALLPSRWFQTPEQARAALERKRVQDELHGGLSEILKDAPLPVRLMGKMMGSVVSSAMSVAAEQMAQQQHTVSDTLAQARKCIVHDIAVQSTFGTPIQVGTLPVSQSTSTSNINGNVRQQVELTVPVMGSSGASGMAQIRATEQGIQSIRVVDTTTGRSIHVSLTESSSSASSSSSYWKGNGDDTIIEAEIIDKDYNNDNKRP